MPFEVFRRHQRKLLAIFAILAMFGFVVSDSLPKLLNPGYGGRDQAVVKLFGETVYRSALNEMIEQRTLANMFVAQLNPYVGATSVRHDQRPRHGRRPDPPAGSRPARSAGGSRDGQGISQADHRRRDEPRFIRDALEPPQ